MIICDAVVPDLRFRSRVGEIWGTNPELLGWSGGPCPDGEDGVGCASGADRVLAAKGSPADRAHRVGAR